jgi:NAD(P)H-flavin reductase
VSTPDEILFKKELDEWTKAENIKIDVTVTKPEESKIKWSGYSGRIDSQMVDKLTSYLVKPTIWLCGPPKMVESMEKTLASSKILSDKIRVEKFTGY